MDIFKYIIHNLIYLMTGIPRLGMICIIGWAVVIFGFYWSADQILKLLVILVGGVLTVYSVFNIGLILLK